MVKVQPLLIVRLGKIVEALGIGIINVVKCEYLVGSTI